MNNKLETERNVVGVNLTQLQDQQIYRGMYETHEGKHNI